MNLLLAHASELVSDEPAGAAQQIVVAGERAEHLSKVLRATVGQRIRVGIVCQSIGTAEVMEVRDAKVVLGSLQMQALGKPPRVRLIIALPRPKALRRLLQTAACFGVSQIDLVNAWRVEKSYWSSPAMEVEAMQQELWLGCEQGRHAWLPTIATHRFLMPFLSELGEGEQRRLLAHPGGQRWLRGDDLKAAACLIAVGPEGGWIEDELSSFGDAGFDRFTLSESILRSEIAVAATLAQLELLAASEQGGVGAGHVQD